MQVREVCDDERAWLRATLEQRWGDEIAVGRGRVWTLHELPALVVDDSGERVGMATYIVEGAVAELVSIDALRTGAGVGRQLLDAVACCGRRAAAGDDDQRQPRRVALRPRNRRSVALHVKRTSRSGRRPLEDRQGPARADARAHTTSSWQLPEASGAWSSGGDAQ